MSKICPQTNEKVIYLTCQECEERADCQKGVLEESKKQKQITLPKEEARSFLVELMHKGYDSICSEADESGNMMITWPASTKAGKQLD